MIKRYIDYINEAYESFENKELDEDEYRYYSEKIIGMTDKDIVEINKFVHKNYSDIKIFSNEIGNTLDITIEYGSYIIDFYINKLDDEYYLLEILKDDDLYFSHFGSYKCDELGGLFKQIDLSFREFKFLLNNKKYITYGRKKDK